MDAPARSASIPPADEESADLRTILDHAPVGRIQILVTALCALTYCVDGFDTTVIGALSPQIGKEFGLGRDQLGMLFSAAVIGAVCGYLIVAPLSAKVGQKVMMAGSTAIFGLLSLLTPFVTSYGQFIALRLLTGLFLGSALPGTVALTGEFAPRRLRSTFITFMALGLATGITSASLATAALLDLGGWRAVMILCGIMPLAVAAMVWKWMPESVFYLSRLDANRARVIAIIQRAVPAAGFTAATRFHVSNSGTGSVLGLVDRNRRLGTLALWTSYFISLMVAFSLQSWLPTIFIDIGFSQTAALWLSATTFSALFLSSVTAGPLMDRFGAFRVVAIMFALDAVFMGLTGAVLHSATPLVLLVVFSATLFNSAAQKGLGVLCVFYYPPRLRATGYAWGSGIGRLGAVAGPIAVGMAMSAHWTPQTLFYAAALPMVVAAGAIVLIQWRYGLGTLHPGGGQRDAA